MPKNLLLPATLLALAAGPALAQSSARPAPGLAADAAAQPGPYCTVLAVSSGIYGSVRFKLSYGDNAPKPPENQLFTEQQQVEALHTTADVLNYLGTRGWELATSTTAAYDGYLVYQYVLRKRPTP